MEFENVARGHAEGAEILSALGNERRLLIMCHLLNGEISVGKIAEKVELSQSALSQHLAKLRALGLVQTRREGQTIYYSSKSVKAASILRTLDSVLAGDKVLAAAFTRSEEQPADAA
jgi:DNA-binding transcriptional ArsR family regulator